MHGDSARNWAVGDIANGHVLAQGGQWVRLNQQTNHVGPWQPGDVVNEHAFTGAYWVPLPSGWWADPTGRHQFRWWTGSSWGSQVQTQGLQFDDPLLSVPPLPPVTMSFHTQPAPVPAPARASLGLIDVVDKIAWCLYGGFWLVVAVFSAATAAQENEPRYLLLTSTASLNILLYKLTGRTRSELNKRARRAVKKKIPYLLCGAIAGGGVWLGLRFDDPNLILAFLFVALIVLLFAWAFS